MFIQLEHIVKKYPDRPFPAVNDISFGITRGEVMGLLGTNGAGKTTTISMLCGLLRPDSGKILLEGSTDLRKLNDQLGVVPQDIALYPTLTIEENLNFFAAQYGLSRLDIQAQIKYWSDRLQLGSILKYRIQHLSGGQKRKANLAAGLLHRPHLLVLDEPTVGVDIHSRQLILEVLQELNKQGLTILYTSHYMEEAQKLCHRIVMMDEGKIVAEGSPADLAAKFGFSGELEKLFLHITNPKS